MENEGTSGQKYGRVGHHEINAETIEVRFMKRLIVGISGATGSIYGIRLLEVLRALGVERHLVITKAAKRTIQLETTYDVEEVKSLADYVHDVENIGDSIASGSFLAEGMAVVPCSMKSLSAIAYSYNDNLLVRAADVTLKEKRRLVLVVRETPLHKGHLKLMLRASDLGAVILPPMPAFYHLPRDVGDIVNHIVGKILDTFGIEHDLFRRWGSEQGMKAEALLAEERLS
jgi:4-hydroxy-3-polyprenylbenzoate decarboxylase